MKDLGTEDAELFGGQEIVSSEDEKEIPFKKGKKIYVDENKILLEIYYKAFEKIFYILKDSEHLKLIRRKI